MQNMPDEFLLRNANNQDMWVSEADNLEIREDSHVRIRIANIQLQPEKLVRCPLSALQLSLWLVLGCENWAHVRGSGTSLTAKAR